MSPPAKTLKLLPRYLSTLNTEYIEELETQYRENPENVDASWRFFFDGMNLNTGAADSASVKSAISDFEFEDKVMEVIQGYREMGHLIADVNPLDRGIKRHPFLELSHFGLTEADLDRVCQSGKVIGLGPLPLRSVILALTAYYCSPVSVELSHIEDPKARDWIQSKVESSILSKPLDFAQKKQVLAKLSEAEVFETFLHKRFPGQKRFSVEGCDAIIPILDFLINESVEAGADEVIMGMAHRGRLNVLANIFKKDIQLMLAEFSGNLEVSAGDGDVKYHMGFSQNTRTAGGKQVHLSLMPNPSHLEAVNPVLLGVTRAKQRLKRDFDKKGTLPILLHGDASFAGQGIIYETLNMSELSGYSVGGTIHIILNNQIGFTTNPNEDRSTPNATDVAKMLEIPILHINADEPEAAIRGTMMALEYRNTFKRDVVIELMGYRRYGHNEADDPSFTQPLMYQKIAKHQRVREIYAHQLELNNLMTRAETEGLVADLDARMENALNETKKSSFQGGMATFGDRWTSLKKPNDETVFALVETGVSRSRLEKLGKNLVQTPDGFHVHPKIQKLLDDRRDAFEGKKTLDWACAESLAFGSLLEDGYPIRLAGQDSERGTFSHRHAVLHDNTTGKRYTPLRNLHTIKTDFEVINSLLSEYGALGFEFGQSYANPKKLTIWEAQFGDFVNGAQIIIDQFIASSASKWQRYSGLVMLLPHGYEGQGPEHSSARIERFLQLCARKNIQVVNATTPAQLFHVLRRQMIREIRIPLILFTPKSLLRHPRVISTLDELENGHFHEVLDETDAGIQNTAKKIIFCQGKIYYELLDAREKNAVKDAALVRVEQLYPFPKTRLTQIISSFPETREIIWCQEEPQNMGSWGFMLQRLVPLLQSMDFKTPLRYVGRIPHSNPADGYAHLHTKEQTRIIREALGLT